MDTRTILIAGSIAAVILATCYLMKKREPFEKLSIITDRQTMYAEPNLNCQLGSSKCRLSTGSPGVCDVHTRECVELPFFVPQKVYRDENLAPPIGERSAECQWRGVCTRSDNNMGVCMSGLCYPATHVVQ
jgi:hypothetical protein